MSDKLNLREFVARQIRLLRLKKGFTQESLAEKADLGFNYVYRLENKNLNVKVETLEKIMKALDVEIETFFDAESPQRDIEFNSLIEDLEKLPKEKRDSLIKAFREILNQLK